MANFFPPIKIQAKNRTEQKEEKELKEYDKDQARANKIREVIIVGLIKAKFPSVFFVAKGKQTIAKKTKRKTTKSRESC